MAGVARASLFDEQAVIKEKFLDNLRQHGIVVSAGDEAGVSHPTLYRWRKEDPAFGEAWDRALAESGERLRRECVRRAVEGHSDTLLIFELKARYPHLYRDNYQVDVRYSGPQGISVGRLPAGELEGLVRALGALGWGGETIEGECRETEGAPVGAP